MALNGQYGLSGQSEVSENGPIGFPMPQDIVLDGFPMPQNPGTDTDIKSLHFQNQSYKFSHFTDFLLPQICHN